MKFNILRCTLVLFLFCTFVVIFNFSNQDSEKSGSVSQKMTEAITKDIKAIQKLNKNEKTKVIDKIEDVIRKIAHFSLYALVGLLLMALFSTYNINEKNKIISTIIIGAIYATSDEFHQNFISGRSGQVSDVFLDTLGVAVGGLFILLIIKMIYELRKYKKDLEKNIL